MRRTVVVATTTALLLAGCAAAPPQATVTPSLEAQAALIESQATAVIDSTFAVLDAADADKNQDLFVSRVAGNAALVRVAEYAVAEAVPEEPVSDLPSKMQGVYVSRSESWPRMLLSLIHIS